MATRTRLQTRPRTAGDFEVVQASHETVNGLLGGTNVSDLPDGVMVQRAWNHRGSRLPDRAHAASPRCVTSSGRSRALTRWT